MYINNALSNASVTNWRHLNRTWYFVSSSIFYNEVFNQMHMARIYFRTDTIKQQKTKPWWKNYIAKWKYIGRSYELKRHFVSYFVIKFSSEIADTCLWRSLQIHFIMHAVKNAALNQKSATFLSCLSMWGRERSDRWDGCPSDIFINWHFLFPQFKLHLVYQSRGKARGALAPTFWINEIKCVKKLQSKFASVLESVVLDGVLRPLHLACPN